MFKLLLKNINNFILGGDGNRVLLAWDTAEVFNLKQNSAVWGNEKTFFYKPSEHDGVVDI